ncbi:hypothetical protein [Comamonas sediminis]|uniref:Uncharacterized protein n=1 Tax=Comamonas sediminis TaxID=1783360 RepID=A0ABV4B222_9BURK
MTKEILCFDFRVPLGAVATTDVNIWKCSDGAVKDLDKRFGGLSQLLDWHVAVGFYETIPIDWILSPAVDQYHINAYVVDAADLKNLIQMYGGFTPTSDGNNSHAKEHVLSNWSSLGFDICTPDLAVSAIHSVKDLNTCFSADAYKFNSRGLLLNRSECMKIIRNNSFSLHDGPGFIPVEIFTNQMEIEIRD